MGKGKKAAQSQVAEGPQALPRAPHSSTDRVGAATAPAAAAATSRQQRQQRRETSKMANTAAYFQAGAGGSSSSTVMPWEIMLELVQRMDAGDRSAWRLANKAACQAVYEATTALAPSSTALKDKLLALPLPLLSKCSGLEQLSCRSLPRLSSIQGLPPGLRVLDIGMTSVTDLSPLKDCTGLRRLSASFICAQDTGGSLSIPQLAAALLQPTGLQHLDLSYNDIGAAGAGVLGPALQGLTGLQVLKLNHTSMGAEGAQALAPALQHLTGLQQLELGGNEFRNEGATALAPALLRLTRLQRLRLSSNQLGPAGITALAPSIRQLRALQLLDLDYNKNLLDAQAAQALAVALRALTGLQELDLACCSLTAVAAQALAPTIKELRAARQLEVPLSYRERELLNVAIAALSAGA